MSVSDPCLTAKEMSRRVQLASAPVEAALSTSLGRKLGVDSGAAALAPGSVTAVRLRQVEVEFEDVYQQLRELSALRLQAWFRHSQWRRSTLPRQFLRVRLLLHSCMIIQAAWRAAVARYAQSNLTLSTSFSPKLCRSLESQCAAVQMSHAGQPDRIKKGIDPAQPNVQEIALLSGSCSEHMSIGRRPNWGLLDIHLGCSLGQAGARVAALWRGYYVRRAISCRSLQMKIKLRHDLYLLISDVEARQKSQARGQPPQRLGPWVDVLYTGLGRLQREVLEGFESVVLGRAPLWGGARLPVTWLGWPCDLHRLPRLALRARELSLDCSEPSLIASTMLQTCTPPRSPLADEAGIFEADAMRMWHHDNQSQNSGRAVADVAAGRISATACLLRQMTSAPSTETLPMVLSSARNCGPREVFVVPSDYEVLATPLEPLGLAEDVPCAMPAKASSTPASPAHCSRDWSKVRPRVDARLVRAGGSARAPVGAGSRSTAGLVRRSRMSSPGLSTASSMPLLQQFHVDGATSLERGGNVFSRIRPGEVEDKASFLRTESVCLDDL